MTPDNKPRVLIVGCGNLLRGDAAAGPVTIRRLWDTGLPPDVHCADGGTGGMDVAFQMRGVPLVVLIDACASGSPPGSIFELPGHEGKRLPPPSGINLNACGMWNDWNNAIRVLPTLWHACGKNQNRMAFASQSSSRPYLLTSCWITPMGLVSYCEPCRGDLLNRPPEEPWRKSCTPWPPRLSPTC